jgi:hypothetical protein
MAMQEITQEGAFTKETRTAINENFAELDAGGSGQSFASPTITGTVAGGATYTAPVLTTPDIGAATGTSVVLSGNCRAASYNVGATAGASGGPFTSVTGITVVNGIVTAIAGT